MQTSSDGPFILTGTGCRQTWEDSATFLPIMVTVVVLHYSHQRSSKVKPGLSPWLVRFPWAVRIVNIKGDTKPADRCDVETLKGPSAKSRWPRWPIPPPIPPRMAGPNIETNIETNIEQIRRESDGVRLGSGFQRLIWGQHFQISGWTAYHWNRNFNI